VVFVVDQVEAASAAASVAVTGTWSGWLRRPGDRGPPSFAAEGGARVAVGDGPSRLAGRASSWSVMPVGHAACGASEECVDGVDGVWRRGCRSGVTRAPRRVAGWLSCPPGLAFGEALRFGGDGPRVVGQQFVAALGAAVADGGGAVVAVAGVGVAVLVGSAGGGESLCEEAGGDLGCAAADEFAHAAAEVEDFEVAEHLPPCVDGFFARAFLGELVAEPEDGFDVAVVSVMRHRRALLGGCSPAAAAARRCLCQQQQEQGDLNAEGSGSGSGSGTGALDSALDSARIPTGAFALVRAFVSLACRIGRAPTLHLGDATGCSPGRRGCATPKRASSHSHRPAASSRLSEPG